MEHRRNPLTIDYARAELRVMAEILREMPMHFFDVPIGAKEEQCPLCAAGHIPTHIGIIGSGHSGISEAIAQALIERGYPVHIFSDELGDSGRERIQRSMEELMHEYTFPLRRLEMPEPICYVEEKPKPKGISKAMIQRNVANRSGFRARKEFWR